jgi:FAD:protein FMN transferase
MDPASASLRRARPLLGTFVEIGVEAAPAGEAEAAIEAAFAAVAKVHELMSYHEQASDVTRLNREACERPVAVDPWTFEVLEAALDLNRRSGGAFDIAVAPALERLGLLPRRARQALPVRASGDDLIELSAGRRVRFRDRGVRIDLGGIAKGFAVDRAVAALREHGICCGLVNAGGDLAAFGPQAQPVDIRDPLSPGRLACRIQIREEALATSGARFDLHGPGAGAETAVIDPATGKPADAVCGASVRAPSCLLADALTKVVMLKGGASGDLLDACGASALVVRADGGVRVTRGWRDAVCLAA